jgi:hypothetical protein
MIAQVASEVSEVKDSGERGVCDERERWRRRASRPRRPKKDVLLDQRRGVHVSEAEIAMGGGLTRALRGELMMDQKTWISAPIPEAKLLGVSGERKKRVLVLHL